MRSGLTQHPITSAIGAVIEGIDAREPIAPETAHLLRQALSERGVIFIHGQDLTAEQLKAFVANFGEPMAPKLLAGYVHDPNPVTEANFEPSKQSTAYWHTDSSFLAAPPMATALRAVRLPPLGGDTCWSSLHAAYDALSQPMRDMVDGLTAIHSARPVLERMKTSNEPVSVAAGFENTHPLVRVHPETGRKALFVNPSFMTRIVELTPAESARLIALLSEHIKSPDFWMRWCWSPNDIAVWDNRSVLHYAVPDYTAERVMQRVFVAGDRPRGPNQAGG